MKRAVPGWAEAGPAAGAGWVPLPGAGGAVGGELGGVVGGEVGGVVGVTSTSGPLAIHLEWEMMMSPVASRLVSRTWMALTVIEVLLPGLLDRSCSLKVTDPRPGTAMTVFGAGLADSPGTLVPKIVVLPVEPGPEAVQLLLTTVAVS